MARRSSVDDFAQSVARNADFRDMRPRRRELLGGEGAEERIFDQVGRPADAHRHHPNEASPLLFKGNQDPYIPLQHTLSNRAQKRVQQLAAQREATREQLKDSARAPLHTTHVHRPDGTVAEVIIGGSTLPQTIFNSANVLIGVGLLSLPLAFRYSGWVFGILGLLVSALVTRYTAGLLAKTLDVDPSLANFADIAYVAFGTTGRAVTSAIVTLELMTGCVGLVILFADSLHALVDQGWSSVQWKVICGLVLLPLNFLPMRWLGFTSFLGIFCSLGILGIAFVMGLVSGTSPGSLRDVATTTALPEHWGALPLSIGLIMALWEGHSIFPNIYRDMRQPPRYESGLRYTFTFVTSVDIGMAVVGYLLYGDGVKDELTKNMLGTQAYPRSLKIVVLALVAVLPLTKFPLHAAPIVSTLEVLTHIDPRAALLRPTRINQSPTLTHCLRAFFRLLVTAAAVILAIALPSFEIISALMGGAFGFLTCVILPVAFHLHMFRDQMSWWRVLLEWGLVGGSVVLGTVGTVWEFLPRRWMMG